MKILNTLTGKKDEFVPLNEGVVNMYVCGPTVYNFIHIGNTRPLCVFDTLRRYFEYCGYKVNFVQNFTDIDDKLINRAKEENTTVKELAEKYIVEYKKDAGGLNVREATVHPKATEHIDDIINLIKTLEDKGFAYSINGDVYFKTKEFKEYGKLSHMPLEDLEAGARINVNEQKNDPMDFALWKSAKEGEPYWQSPWGKGRPGWHIECSAMSRSILGETIDLHCGGQDLIFPHHENEIAQSECASGKCFSRYWMHNGYINIDNKKMSKSLGNFFTAREVGEKFGYEPIRYIMISSHYRSPINYSVEIVEQAKASLSRLYNCRENLAFALKNAVDTPADSALIEALNSYEAKFKEAMDDDFNTADALAAVFDLVREINSNVVGKEAAREYVQKASEIFERLINVLGLLYEKKDDADLDGEIEALIAKRQEARKNRDFKTADEIRDTLKAQGIVLEDTPAGVKWHRA
ncbi:MAG: cysteine--tRNA ligase [Oscillospiraceae bacterium]|nr:cysteine--tRNA ligase [Oscillospiraceae bacterium]